MVLRNPYMTLLDYVELATATSYEEIGAVALRIQERYPDELVQVCGPISTGGFGDVKKNLYVFEKTIVALLRQGLNVYNQMPLEKDMMRVRKIDPPGEGQYPLLEGIYRPLFASGKLVKAYFIHGWDGSQDTPPSIGSLWEHNCCKEYGIPIDYLPKGYGLDKEFNSK